MICLILRWFQVLPSAPYSCRPSTPLEGCTFGPKGEVPSGSIWFIDLQDYVTETYNVPYVDWGQIQVVSLVSKWCWLSGPNPEKHFESDLAPVKFSGRILADISEAGLSLWIVLLMLGRLLVHLANMFKCLPGLGPWQIERHCIAWAYLCSIYKLYQSLWICWIWAGKIHETSLVLLLWVCM